MHVREDLTVLISGDQVPDLSTKVHGEVRGVRHQHHFVRWVPPHVPCSVVDRYKLGFAVAGRDGHADAVLAPGLDVFEQMGQPLVVAADLVVVLHVLAEGYEIIPQELHSLALREVPDDVVELLQLSFAELVDVLEQQVDFFLAEAAVKHPTAPRR